MGTGVVGLRPGGARFGRGGDRSNIRLPQRGFSPPTGLRLAAKRTRGLDDLLAEGFPPGLGGSLPEEAIAPEKSLAPGGQGGRDLKALDKETKNRNRNYSPDRIGIFDPYSIDTSSTPVGRTGRSR